MAIFIFLPLRLKLRSGPEGLLKGSVLCVVPTGEFKPQSEAELLAELNQQLPFTIPRKHFVSKQRSSGLVGWAVVRNDREKDLAKAQLKKSTTLKLLQVEGMTLEFEKLMKQHKK